MQCLLLFLIKPKTIQIDITNDEYFINFCMSSLLFVAFILLYGSGLGVTMGAHRLWSHRSFKATASLRLFLLWLHTLAGQVSCISLHLSVFGRFKIF